MTETGEDRLRAAYTKLLARRARETDPPDIPVERVQALAAGEYREDDRAEQLEAVLADARTAAEFEFFRELTRQRPAPRHWLPTWLTAAAAIIVVFGAALIWRATHPVAPDVMRSAGDDFLLAPAADARITAAARFTWQRVSGAETYRLQLIDEEGMAVLDSTVTDTLLVLPAGGKVVTGSYRWWVTARLRDGTDRSTPARHVTLQQ